MTATDIDYRWLAGKAAGNWLKFQCFAWYGQPQDPENWAVFYTRHRDSGLLAVSNHHAIAASLDNFDDGDDPTLFWQATRTSPLAGSRPRSSACSTPTGISPVCSGHGVTCKNGCRTTQFLTNATTRIGSSMRPSEPSARRVAGSSSTTRRRTGRPACSTGCGNTMTASLRITTTRARTQVRTPSAKLLPTWDCSMPRPHGPTPQSGEPADEPAHPDRDPPEVCDNNEGRPEGGFRWWRRRGGVPLVSVVITTPMPPNTTRARTPQTPPTQKPTSVLLIARPICRDGRPTENTTAFAGPRQPQRVPKRRRTS